MREARPVRAMGMPAGDHLVIIRACARPSRAAEWLECREAVRFWSANLRGRRQSPALLGVCAWGVASGPHSHPRPCRALPRACPTARRPCRSESSPCRTEKPPCRAELAAMSDGLRRVPERVEYMPVQKCTCSRGVSALSDRRTSSPRRRTSRRLRRTSRRPRRTSRRSRRTSPARRRTSRRPPRASRRPRRTSPARRRTSGRPRRASHRQRQASRRPRRASRRQDWASPREAWRSPGRSSGPPSRPTSRCNSRSAFGRCAPESVRRHQTNRWHLRRAMACNQRFPCLAWVVVPRGAPSTSESLSIIHRRERLERLPTESARAGVCSSAAPTRLIVRLGR